MKNLRETFLFSSLNKFSNYSAKYKKIHRKIMIFFFKVSYFKEGRPSRFLAPGARKPSNATGRGWNFYQLNKKNAITEFHCCDGCLITCSWSSTPSSVKQFKEDSCPCKTKEISCWISWPLKMTAIGRPETSVTNYHHTPPTIPEERRSHRGAKPKSRKGWSNGSDE